MENLNAISDRKIFLLRMDIAFMIISFEWIHTIMFYERWRKGYYNENYYLINISVLDQESETLERFVK